MPTLSFAGAMPDTVQDQEVTPLELFFDLVFVFAITQVSSFVSDDATWTHLLEGVAILAVLWWAWVSYAWLGNTAASDDGAVRVVLLSAMGAMLIVSVAVPGAFTDHGLIFGVAYLAVRLLHLGAYALLARADPSLRGVVARLASTAVPGAALLVLGGALHGTPRAICWVAALVVDYGGLAVRGVEGWRVQPSHFAERHGLIIIIALGESIVSLGLGASGLDLDARVVTGALLGVAISAALWWAYFDVVAIVAERRLRDAPYERQIRIARDSYTYLHLPMVAGIVVFAVGAKRALEVSGELPAVPAWALCAGVALYLVALSAFKRRNVGSWNQPRLVAAVALVALAPVATQLPALVSLTVVALVVCALIAFEVTVYSAARERIRHAA